MTSLFAMQLIFEQNLILIANHRTKSSLHTETRNHDFVK
jgi:hypothetical protein